MTENAEGTGRPEDPQHEWNLVELEAALLSTNAHLTSAAERLEDVPPEAFSDPEDRWRVGRLIARAGAIVAGELECLRASSAEHPTESQE